LIDGRYRPFSDKIGTVWGLRRQFRQFRDTAARYANDPAQVDDGVSKPYSFSGMQKIVQRMRKAIGLPAEFTLDACRHVGMTDLKKPN
jgi:hypothetical protein